MKNEIRMRNQEVPACSAFELPDIAPVNDTEKKDLIGRLA